MTVNRNSNDNPTSKVAEHTNDGKRITSLSKHIGCILPFILHNIRLDVHWNLEQVGCMSFMWFRRFSSDMDIVLDTRVRESIQITLIRHELPTKHNAFIAEGFVLSDILNIFVSHPIDYNTHL